MTTMLETEIRNGQAARDSRFFEPINPWVLERAKALPVIKTASKEAEEILRQTPQTELDAWKKDQIGHPLIDQLVLSSNTYADVSSVVKKAGQTAMRNIMTSPPKMEIIGENPYWTVWLGQTAVLATTDETREPLIYFAADDEVEVDPDNSVHLATPIDYARLLIDIDQEQSGRAKIA